MTKLRTVVETSTFVGDILHSKLSDLERAAIITEVARRPEAGDLVVGAGGVRKVRIAGRGKGKSGGYRVMTLYVGRHAPVYLLAMLSKGERATFSQSEIRSFRELAIAIKAFWKDKTYG